MKYFCETEMRNSVCPQQDGLKIGIKRTKKHAKAKQFFNAIRQKNYPWPTCVAAFTNIRMFPFEGGRGAATPEEHKQIYSGNRNVHYVPAIWVNLGK